MSPWLFHAESQKPYRKYERELGLHEEAFYWDSVFSGTADLLRTTKLIVRKPNLLRLEHLTKAWIQIKRKYPLLAARLKEVDNGRSVHFIVEEDALNTVDAQEIRLLPSVSSEMEFNTLVQGMLNGSRHLSNQHVSRVYLVKRLDVEYTYHLFIFTAHLITDGIADATLLRTFLEYISSTKVPVEDFDLEKRLALAIPTSDLVPSVKKSLAMRRWHRAIGHVLSDIRQTRFTGGHTLPRRFTTDTLNLKTPAETGFTMTSFTTEESKLIMQTCRKHGLTFGNVYPVIGQIALTRVLCRRYIRGEMDQQEWDFRRRECMLTAGPVNMRPFLDAHWNQSGGAENVSLAINFVFYTLPFMPLGKAAGLLPGDPLPHFTDLLSPNRFFYRAGLMKKQSRDILYHPRFVEISGSKMPARLERVRSASLQWRTEQRGWSDAQPLSPKEQAALTPVYGHGGSSFGNVDRLIPTFYPDASEPTIEVLEEGSRLHCRPNELYLGAGTFRQHLKLHVFYDSKVYDHEIIQEWLAEVESAVRCYLIPQIQNKL